MKIFKKLREFFSNLFSSILCTRSVTKEIESDEEGEDQDV